MPARTAKAARPTPTPMPMVAPEERPPESDEEELLLGDGDEELLVEAVEFVPSASALLLLVVDVPVGTLAPVSSVSWLAILSGKHDYQDLEQARSSSHHLGLI
jgi:hypothetical protein